MTWIVGASSYYGSAILVSDICVTFKHNDGSVTYHDCLQKIYPLGKYVIGGFSGSVSLGFKMLAALQSEAVNRLDDELWNMDIIANTWLPKVARHIFRDAHTGEKQLGCSLIIASAHPMKNRGPLPWERTDIHVMSAPHFKPLIKAPNEVVSIGSGSGMPDYIEALEKIQKNDSLLEVAQQGPDFLALIIADIIRDTVNNSSQEGVSKYVQVGLVTRGQVRIGNVEYRDANSDGSDTITRAPPVARGYQEFVNYCRHIRKSEAKATCSSRVVEGRSIGVTYKKVGSPVEPAP